MTLSPSSAIVPKTLLEAVNDLLGCVRLSGVMSLQAADLNEDAEEALRALTGASISVQTKGWNYNTSEGAELLPDATNGEVKLPQNTLKVRSIRCSSRPKLVQRGERLYDTQKRTFSLGVPVVVDLVEGLAYEDLPSTARLYIVALAAQTFAPPRQPSGMTLRYTTDFLREALADMEHEDSESRSETLPETSPHFAMMARR